MLVARENRNERIAGLTRPVAHHASDGFPRNMLKCAPQVFGRRVSILMLFEIVAQAISEIALAQIFGEHAYDRGAFVVTYSVKDFADFVRVMDLNLNGVRCCQ